MPGQYAGCTRGRRCRVRALTLPQIYALFLVRQRRTFLVVAVVSFLAVCAVTLSLPKEYRATATLFVGENRPVSTGANAVQLDDVLARTYTSLMQTSDVEREVVRAMPFRIDRAQFADAVSFSVVTGTRLIRIDALDPEPERARQIAQTYATTFVRRQQDNALRDSSGRLGNLLDQIGKLGLTVARLAAGTTPDAIRERSQAASQLQAAQQSYVAAQQANALQGSNVSLSSSATRPTTPAKPRLKLDLALGLILALVLGGLAALLRDSFDDRVRDEEELSKLLDLPILARVALRKGPDSADDTRRQEQLDLLCASLQADPGLRVISVTSAMPQDGKSSLVLLLARALARRGTHVAVVDCDLRRPMLADYVRSEPSKGMTNLLVEPRRSAGELMVATRYPNVELLAAGPLAPSPSSLLSLPRLRTIFVEVGQDRDYVLVDTPPANVAADASTVAAQVDGVIFVVDPRRSRRRALRAARDLLSRSRATVLGVVVNGDDGRDGAYGIDYYGPAGGRRGSRRGSSLRDRGRSRGRDQAR